MGGEVGEVIHRPDRVGQGARSAGAEEFQRDDLDRPVDPGDADPVAAHRADRAADMGAVAVVVIGIVVVVDEIPADQVVDEAIRVVVDPVFPAAVGQQVARVDETVCVAIPHPVRVGGVVQVAQGDQPVGVDVGQADPQGIGDFPLVQPDIGEQVGVRVVDPGVDDPDDGRGRAGETVRPGLSGLAAIGVRDRRRIAVHAPQPAAGIAGIGADRCDRRHPQVDRGHLMRLGQTRLIGIPMAIGGTAQVRGSRSPSLCDH